MSPTPEERAGTVRFNMPGKTDREIVALIAEAIRQAEAAAREEEREACAQVIDLFQDIIGWQEGESRNALVCEIRDRIRARNTPAVETAGAEEIDDGG